MMGVIPVLLFIRFNRNEDLRMQDRNTPTYKNFLFFLEQIFCNEAF
jgi:hypothetical protein